MRQRLLRAAWKLDADKGIARIKKLAALLDHKYPQAAASLLEGLEDRLTMNWHCCTTDGTPYNTSDDTLCIRLRDTAREQWKSLYRRSKRRRLY